MTTAEFAAALGAQKNGAQFMARCPAHDDRTPSLSIRDVNGRTLVRCHAGCSQTAVIDALRELGLWGANGRGGTNGNTNGPASAPTTPDLTHPTLGTPTRVYEWHARTGAVVGGECRWDLPDGRKTVRHVRRTVSGWEWHAMAAPRPLYNLPELLEHAGKPVLAVEGPKCVEAVRALLPEYVVTTSAGGAKAAERTDWTPLRGRKVYVWPDNDQPGAQYAATVARLCHAAGARGVYLVRNPADAPEGWDVADGMADGWTAESVGAQLSETAEPIDPPVGDSPPNTDNRFRLLTDHDLENQPPRVELVADTATVGAFLALIGPPANLKTTLALDLACAIPTGTSWHGRAVRRGPVVYVAAEGIGGFGARLKAWKLSNNWHDTVGVYVLPHAVNLMDPVEVGRLLRAIGTLPEPPVLLIFDTLARCLVGGEENSAKDVGLWINGADQLRAETGAAVLVVHHSGKNTAIERGSSALRGAADTLLLVEREDEQITITCDKQKDSAPFAPIHLAVKVVTVDERTSACVLIEDTATGFTRKPVFLPATRRKALDALRDVDTGDGATAAEWQRVSGLPERTFHRAIKDLVQWEHVTRSSKGRGARYRPIEVAHG